MNPEEIDAQVQEEFSTGPLRFLTDSVKNNTQVLINCRNNKKLLGRVKAFEGTAIWFLSRSKRFGLKSLRLAKAPKEGKASKQG